MDHVLIHANLLFQENHYQTKMVSTILMAERVELSVGNVGSVGRIVELSVEGPRVEKNVPDEINIKNIQKQNVVVEKVINNIIIIYNAT